MKNVHSGKKCILFVGTKMYTKKAAKGQKFDKWWTKNVNFYNKNRTGKFGYFFLKYGLTCTFYVVFRIMKKNHEF